MLHSSLINGPFCLGLPHHLCWHPHLLCSWRQLNYLSSLYFKQFASVSWHWNCPLCFLQRFLRWRRAAEPGSGGLLSCSEIQHSVNLLSHIISHARRYIWLTFVFKNSVFSVTPKAAIDVVVFFYSFKSILQQYNLYEIIFNLINIDFTHRFWTYETFHRCRSDGICLTTQWIPMHSQMISNMECSHSEYHACVSFVVLIFCN